MKKLSELKKFWKRYAPYTLHPEDEECLGTSRGKHCLHIPLEEIREKFQDKNGSLKAKSAKAEFVKQFSASKILTNMFAVPFQGNIEKAKFFILTGNPGFEPGDYEDEHEDKGYIRLLENNLRFRSESFFCLDPAAKRTGGFEYWSKPAKIPRVAKALSEIRADLSFDDCYEFVKRNTCVIETVAYHSCNSPSSKIYNLPSSQLMKDFVQKELTKRANNGEVFIFVWRSASIWNLKPSSNIMIRPPKKAQASSIFSNEAETIAKFLESKHG